MSKRKILIIEDEQDLARLLAQRLIKSEFEISIAADAYQGFSFALHELPDMVILDLMLPAGGGLDVLRRIRANAKTMSLPVIIVTGVKDKEYERQAAEQGVQAYFQKPYEFDELLKKIKEILSMG